MRFPDLQRIQKLFFGREEIAHTLGLSPASARVTASRYAKRGLLVRPRRNLYLLGERWRHLDREERFVVANMIQVPSYVSFMTAMDYHEVTTQIQRDFIESASLKRSVHRQVGDVIFRYSKLHSRLYFGFVRRDQFFIALPEKAFLDALYLTSLGRYSLDLSSINIQKLNRIRILSWIRRYPLKTRRLFRRYESISKTRTS